MKPTYLISGIVGVFALATNVANAGAKEVVVTPEPAAVEEADLGFTLSAGYDSTYIFRGVDYGDNGVWVGLDYEIPNTPLALGVWYINPSDGDQILDDELDLYATVSQSYGALDVWLGFTAYLFPELGDGHTYELATGVGTSLGPIDLGLSAAYDFEIEGWFFELTAGHSFPITDRISLDLAAGISYQIDYNSNGSDFNNILLMASLPIELTDGVVFTPYIAGTISLDAVEDFQDDELFGGASLAVSF